jgi:hypothetical protein
MSHEQSMTDRDEALEAWHRVYGEDGEAPQLESLARRLAVSLVRNSELRRFLQDEAVGNLPPTSRFIDDLTDVTVRVRITPLVYLAEHDTHVAEFLVRHPAAIDRLLAEQGEVFGDRSEERLTPRLKTDPAGFLRKMKVIAPLLLERADLGAERVEAFLDYLHRQDVLERLAAAVSVRSELGSILAGFCRERLLGDEQSILEYMTPSVIDNILWQVAAAVVSQYEDQEGRDIAEVVDRTLRDERGGGRRSADPAADVRFALADCSRRYPAEAVRRVDQRLTKEFEILSK